MSAKTAVEDFDELEELESVELLPVVPAPPTKDGTSRRAGKQEKRFRPDQVQVLSDYFQAFGKTLKKGKAEELANKTGLTPLQVRNWIYARKTDQAGRPSSSTAARRGTEMQSKTPGLELTEEVQKAKEQFPYLDYSILGRLILALQRAPLDRARAQALSKQLQVPINIIEEVSNWRNRLNRITAIYIPPPVLIPTQPVISISDRASPLETDHLSATAIPKPAAIPEPPAPVAIAPELVMEDIWARVTALDKASSTNVVSTLNKLCSPALRTFTRAVQQVHFDWGEGS